jgi:hypothetical protein
MMKRAVEAFQNGLDAVCGERWFRLYGTGLCILALVVARYGAGFTWRQVFVGLLVYGIWQSGAEFYQRVEKKPEFQRIQFTISLTNLGQALVDAGIYSEDEVKQNGGALWDCVGRCSCYNITFTWLEQKLFFLNESSRFSEFAELSIGLKPFRDRALKIGSDFFWYDRIELRGKDEYELVLIKSENQRGKWRGILPDDEGPTLTLIKLPWELFRSLQEPLKGHGSLLKRMTDRENRQREILERAGLKYCQHDEMSDVWHYQGTYATLDWQTF